MADFSACPVEVATRAVELVWGEGGGEAWKADGGESVETDEDMEMGDPTIGIALEVSHSKMGSREEHIIVPSFLALANAGFYDDAERLMEAWEGATEDLQLLTLLALLGEGDD